MAKIRTYPSASTPLSLSDILIGTDVNDNNNTKNFSLGDVLNLFSNSFPSVNLQNVLNSGNTATQSINLTGTITATNIKPANITDINITTGSAGQFLTRVAGGIQWAGAPVATLQQVLDAGNAASQNINLSGIITTSRIHLGMIRDSTNSYGSNGQVLTSQGATGVFWVTPNIGVSKIIAGTNITISPTTGVGDVVINSTGGGSGGTQNLQSVLNLGNSASQNINLTGTITATTIKPVDITDVAVSNGSTGQVLTKGASGILWANISGSSPLTTKGDLYTFSTVNTRFPVGTNGQVLSADSTQATGLKWITLTPGGVTQIIAGTNVTISPSGGTGAVTINATGGGGGGSIAILDHGNLITSSATSINFVGEGVSATASGTSVTVAIGGGGGGGVGISLPVPKVFLRGGTALIQALDASTGGQFDDILYLHKYPLVIGNDLTQELIDTYPIYVEMVHFKRKSKGKHPKSAYVVEPDLRFNEDGDRTWNVAWPQNFFTRNQSPSWSPGGVPYYAESTPGVPVLLNRPNWYRILQVNEQIPVWQYLNSRFYGANVAYRNQDGNDSDIDTIVPVYGSKNTSKNVATNRYPYSSIYTPLYVAFRYIAWVSSANGGLGQIVSGPLSRVIKVVHKDFPFKYDYNASGIFGVPCASISDKYSMTELQCFFETRLP
jgi:hypothetical protein